MRVLFFGIYNLQYSRTIVVREGLRRCGVEVIECRVDPAGWRGLLRLAWHYWKTAPRYDVMLVGFPGQEVMFLARLLTRRPIVFDAFTSHYGGYVLDRQKVSPTSVRARWLQFLDYWSCRLADRVLLDTQAHIEFFVGFLGLPRALFRRVWVGADSEVFYPRTRDHTSNRRVRVHFHGYFSPLHGVETIIRAASLLRDHPIDFVIYGEGQTLAANQALARALDVTHVVFRHSVDRRSLAEAIGSSDICLGIFGNSPKIDWVIPNKVFEAWASGRPVITADSLAIRELATDRLQVYLCKRNDPEDLARAIIDVAEDGLLRERLGRSGRQLFEDRLTEQSIGETIRSVLVEVHSS